MLCALITILSTAVFAQQNTADRSVLTMERNKVDNTPTSIFFSPETNWTEGQAMEIFTKYLGRGSDNAMVLANTITTKSGTATSRYYQYFKGVKIEYGSATLTSKDGRISFLTANFYNTDPSLVAVPGMAEEVALKSALARVDAQKYMWQNPMQEQRIKNFYHKGDTSYFPKGKLVWIEDYSNGMITDRKLCLAWKFDIYAEQPLSRQEVFVDGSTGKILFVNNLIKHTAASGASAYSGTVPFQSAKVPLAGGYLLYDSTRGNGVHTLNMNNGTNYTSATEFVSATNTWPTTLADNIALDAHWGGEMVYDFWKTQMGRSSWDNADGELVQYVHYDVGYDNAFWDGAEMTYGDGTGCAAGFAPLTSLDVTGHEIGHGVCQATANLVYASESGAMNEGFSDCWGASIENWANPHEVDAVPKDVWAIGEEIDCGSPLRRMDNPKSKGDPDCYGGTNWVPVVSCTPSSGNDECGVHTNSGVLNKWYYLITAGDGLPHTNDLANTYVVTGMGFTKSQQILYQTELALPSTADYAMCRTISINAALTLFGPCSQEVITVTNAWYAVGVGTAFTPCLPNIGFVNHTLNVSENAATTACPASKTYTIGLKPFGPAFTGGNPAVNVIAAHGSAVAGVDYVLASTSLVFPLGSTATQFASITVYDNGAVHDDKNLVLGFTLTPNGSNATVSTTNDSFYVNINNDDSIPDPGHVEYHTLDAGSSVVSNLTSAFPGTNSRAHSQFLLYKDELITAGVKPGVPMTQIAFNIVHKMSAVPFVGYTVSMANTTFADMSSIFATGLTTVYTGNHTTNNGIDSLDFNMANFSWDGTSNVVVEICYGKNSATATANDSMMGISGSAVACDHAQTTSGSGTGCSLAYDGSGNSNARPVMRFKQLVPPTPVETLAGSTHTWDVKAGQEVYFYNTVDNFVISGLKNTTNNLGCVTSTITQQGTGFVPAVFSPINRSLKEFSFSPTINGSVTTYDAIIYLTNTELNGVPPASLFLVKTDALTDAAVTTFNSTELTPTLITGSNYVGFKGTFTGFAGTGTSRYFLVDGPICNKPVPVITPAGPTTFCMFDSVLLNANTGSGLTYQWQLGGADIPGATNAAFRAHLAGNYTVTEHSGACNATSAITAITTTTVTVAPVTGPSGVCIGGTVAMSDATTGGVWTSSNTALATIGGSGILSGLSPGTVTINYAFTNSCGTATSSATLNVSNPSAVAPISGSLQVCSGGTTPLADVTLFGTWSSSNTVTATVNSAGVVSGLVAGTAIISYNVTNAFGCVSSAVATVTVNPLPASAITPIGSTVICAGGGSLVMNATSGSGLTYQWRLSGGDITGATTSAYTTSIAGSFTVLITNSNGCSALSSPVTTSISGTVVVPSVLVTPSPGAVVCVSGATVTYHTSVTNAGSAPVYAWFVNGLPSGSGTPFMYIPANGDVVKCRLTSSAACATPDTATATVTMTVGVFQTPSVSIASAPLLPICTGTITTFSPVPLFGGSAPTYQWTKNGLPVSSLPTYSYIPSNGDVLRCKMTSNYACLATPTANSSAFTVVVEAPSVNKDSIYATKSAIVTGQVDTFVAIAPHGGSSPSYQWYLNGAKLPGETNSIYVTTTLFEGDAVRCAVTTSDPCAYPATGYSNTLKMHIGTGIKETSNSAGNFTLIPNPNKGTFTISGSLGNAGDNKVDIAVTDMLGQTVYKQSAVADNGTLDEQITLGNSLANGIYLVSVTCGSEHIVFHAVLDK